MLLSRRPEIQINETLTIDQKIEHANTTWRFYQLQPKMVVHNALFGKLTANANIILFK